MSQRLCPEVGAFFEQYPIPNRDIQRFAAETGFAEKTVQQWTRGKVRPARSAFDCLVAAYVRPRYAVDEDFLAQTRSACGNRTSWRSKRTDQHIPPLPGEQQPEPEDVPDVELDTTFYLLRLTLRATPLSTAQRLTLIRELCGSE